jgi:hypothetical protein
VSLPASDNFNRADANPIGGNWTTVPGANPFQILGQKAQGTVANVSNASYWNADAFADDQWSQLTHVVRETNSGAGPIVRAQADANTFYLFAAISSVSRYYRCVGGSMTQLGSNAGNTWEGVPLKLEVVGDVLTGYIDGAAQSTRTDSNIPGGGAAGMRAYGTAHKLDDWSGGNMATGNRRRRLLLGSCT